MAEEERFELSEGYQPSPVFKTGAFGHSATPPRESEVHITLQNLRVNKKLQKNHNIMEIGHLVICE